MTDVQSPQPEGADLVALIDLCTPWCVHVVATLRIADHIEAGVDEVGALAAAAECNAGILYRILIHLVGKGVFQKVAARRFALNEAARGLLDPTLRLGLDLNGIGGRMAHAWGGLLTLVQTGKPAYHEIFGRPFWEDLEAHPDVAASFDALMGPQGHGTPDPQILLREDWESVRTVVDVGGGTGAMLAEILRARPEIRGTLVDLPRTVARADDFFQAAGVAGRVKTIGQSFFDPLPAGADLYLLKSVLNDWPDEEATAILRRCAEAVQPKGRIVVLGGVLQDDEAAGITPEMVLVGGNSRAVARFREMAREAGLEVSAAGRQPSGHFVVECRPA